MFKRILSAAAIAFMTVLTVLAASRTIMHPDYILNKYNALSYAAEISESEKNDPVRTSADTAGNEPRQPEPAALSEGSASLNTLKNASVEISVNDVSAGEDLHASAVISGLSGSIICSAEWYYDGQPLSSSDCLMLHNGSEMKAFADITYTQDMELYHTLGLRLCCTETSGAPNELYEQTDFTVTNYSAAYYERAAAAEAIRNASGPSDVTSVYKGGGLSSYNVDYPAEVKTAFVNEKGYSSRTDYLAWVNLATQKVNIFTGSQGNWTLLHTFRCATGASSTPTPTGVTYVTYKQTAWVTDEYTVKYVTRFYPGSGYAFHSILYTPDGSRVQSAAMGYPTSHGCVRTEDAGVRWIYNNLPVNSTVVIF